MVMDLFVPDLSLFVNAFTKMEILGNSGVLTLILSVLICAVITRDNVKWKLLHFPVMVVLVILGMPMSIWSKLIMFGSAIMFALETQVLNVIGNVITGVAVASKTGGNRLWGGIKGSVSNISDTMKKKVDELKFEEGARKLANKLKSEKHKEDTKYDEDYNTVMGNLIGEGKINQKEIPFAESLFIRNKDDMAKKKDVYQSFRSVFPSKGEMKYVSIPQTRANGFVESKNQVRRNLENINTILPEFIPSKSKGYHRSKNRNIVGSK